MKRKVLAIGLICMILGLSKTTLAMPTAAVYDKYQANINWNPPAWSTPTIGENQDHMSNPDYAKVTVSKDNNGNITTSFWNCYYSDESSSKKRPWQTATLTNVNTYSPMFEFAGSPDWSNFDSAPQEWYRLSFTFTGYGSYFNYNSTVKYVYHHTNRNNNSSVTHCYLVCSYTYLTVEL